MNVQTAQLSLREQAFSPLAIGEIRPAGWLLNQLRIQADGLSGHLDEFWPDIAQSGWIGGDAEGWERGPYWLDGLVPLAYLLDDEALKTKVRNWIDYIIAHQHDDGWLGTIHDRLVQDPSTLRPGRSVYNSHSYDPWPRSIVLKALSQYFEATGDERVFGVMKRFLEKVDQLLEEQWLRSWARYRWSELVLSIHWLYGHTGDGWLLDLAERLKDQGFGWSAHFERFPFREKLSRPECDLTSHGPNNAMAIKTPGVWFRQSNDPADRAMVDRIIAVLDAYHGQATGMFSCDEHLAGRSPLQGTELCAVVEYMYSLEVLIGILGEVRHADRLELLAFNALPATMSPDMWTHQYDQQVNQVVCRISEERVYTSNGPDSNLYGLEPNFGCCTANMHQGWPKFATHLWMRSQDGGLAVVAYAPCRVTTEIDGAAVHAEVETNYPFSEDIQITVRGGPDTPFPLHLRIPEWAEGTVVHIGSNAIEPPRTGTFCTVMVSGDETVITVRLGMRFRIERRFRDSVSIYRGPLLFALKIGEAWKNVRERELVDDWEVHPTSPWNYALDLNTDQPNIRLDAEAESVGDHPFAPDSAPMSAVVQGRRIPKWTLERNAAGPVPPSPVRSDEPMEELTLIPYGCTNLRVAEFPLLQQVERQVPVE